MRLIISGGGTGGHVYPALAVVPELNRLVKQRRDELHLCWIGSLDGMERGLVERAGLAFEAIPAGAIRGRNPVGLAKSLWQLSQGYVRSRQIIRTFKPEALLVTGGYVCVPMALAARQAGLPLIIYLPDLEPGLAIKFLARFADRVAVTAPQAQQFFRPGLTVVTGYPVSSELFAAAGPARVEQKIAARRRLGLAEAGPVLLVFGGSRGARAINRAVTAQLEDYLSVSQVFHVSGTLDEAWVQARRAALPPDLLARYHVSAYVHEEKADAFLAADLMIARAGASVMGELPAAGLPAVLAPYPYAGAHQALNAAYLAGHQAALVIKDEDLSQKLKETVINLLTDPLQLQAMSRACQSLARPDAAARLAQEILEVGTYGN
ncbi:MAG: undecaprenyldiphospho-muramoylpentapeptide beta-N-acetylglucosaminyltransferase [Chloroflexota bacterium]